MLVMLIAYFSPMCSEGVVGGFASGGQSSSSGAAGGGGEGSLGLIALLQCALLGRQWTMAGSLCPQSRCTIRAWLSILFHSLTPSPPAVARALD